MSKYDDLFDEIDKECDMSNLSEHTLGAIFWDHQQKEIDRLVKERDEYREFLEQAPFDFNNGVKSPCGSMDEGNVLGTKYLFELLEKYEVENE